jgi:hypothetical protein
LGQAFERVVGMIPTHSKINKTDDSVLWTGLEIDDIIGLAGLGKILFGVVNYAIGPQRSHQF